MTTKNQITITSEQDIPSEFGAIRSARKKSTVQIREPNAPEETFKKSWGDLVGKPGEDYVVFSDADPEGYPCKIDIFNATYVETAAGSGEYQKTELSRLVQIPEGQTVSIKTLEGDIEASGPDYVVIGKEGEVYANRESWVEENLEFVD